MGKTNSNSTGDVIFTATGSGSFSFTSDPWAASPTLNYSYEVVGNTITLNIASGHAANTNSSVAADTDVFIPAAYRPSATQYILIPAPINNVQSIARADIQTTGFISYHPYNANVYTTGQTNTGFYTHTLIWNF